jgi:Fasciclin domain
MQSTNLTSTLDNTTGITAFIPNNAAVTASGGSLSATAVNNHIVKGFVGYLPDLVVGSTLTTAAGQGVQITVVNGDYFVGGAKILQSNLILDNGVAHVIDTVSVFINSVG